MARKKGKGKSVKQARKKFGAHYESDDVKLAPHSMVIHRGEVDKYEKALIQDFRKVMEPFTAKELKATKKNSLKDFISIAGPLHVTHLMVFTHTELSDYMKIIRLPRGPTITFKLLEYSLCNDVLSTMKKRHTHQKQFLHQPLLIMNGFNTKPIIDGDKAHSGELHHKLLTATLQNMFPSINVTKVHLEDIRRCVLFNYNKDDQTIDFRQYNIRLMPVGLSKPVKKLVQEKLPDLSNYQDISEFIEKGGNLSESEAEFDGPDNQVELPQDVNQKGSVNLKNTTSAIRLSEIGPRLKLKLLKIEEGVCDGEVLYHDLITKTTEELKIIRDNLKQKKKAEKEKNLLKKKQAQARNDKLKKKNKNKDGSNDEESNAENGDDEDDEDEDLEYYRKEIGHDPKEDFFKKKPQKRKRSSAGGDNDNFVKKNRHELDVLLDDESKPKKKKVEDEDTNDKAKKFVKFGKSNNKSGPKKASSLFLGFSKKKRELKSNKQ